MKRLVHMLALCGVVAALSACGGSSGVSAASYVHSVCTAAATWKSAIITAGQKLEFGLSSKSLTQTKANYVQFVQALESATAHAANELAAAGTPRVSGGKSIASTIVRVFNTAKINLGHAVSEAASIPTTSKSAFNAAALYSVPSVGMFKQMSTKSSAEASHIMANRPMCTTSVASSPMMCTPISFKSSRRKSSFRKPS